jgi:tRNA nucleotidyltransferase (CCA-adding enzyme)
MMGKVGEIYPQVEPTVSGLMERRIARCAPDLTVSRALGLARRTGARIVVVGRDRAVRAAELRRAVDWGLRRARVGDVARGELPAVPATASEVTARRLLLEGAPLVLVSSGGRIVGVVDATTQVLARPALSVAHRLEPATDLVTEARLWLLRRAGKVGEAAGMPVHAVGGFVRDILAGRPALDVDLVVEGDGPDFARRLAAEIGGRVTLHPDFGTAAVEDARTSEGIALGRLDVARARRERYRAPGASPRVSPAALVEDLGRRDFSINAMALALAPSAFGRLVDAHGGQRDLAARRLRPLHPLSMVEDPTRIFRAARYAARLGLGLHPSARRALGLALGATDLSALSGQRLRAELATIVNGASGGRALDLLARWQAFTILDRRLRATPSTRARLRDAGRLAGWMSAAGLRVDAVEIALVALLLDQRPPVVRGCLARLAISGGPARRLTGATVAGRRVARRLGGRSLRPREVDAVLTSVSAAELAAAWMLAGAAGRRRIQWYLVEGRAVRAALSGEDVVRLGIPRGPAVGRCLAELRARRLDGVVATAEEEEAFVHRWRVAEKGDPR